MPEPYEEEGGGEGMADLFGGMAGEAMPKKPKGMNADKEPGDEELPPGFADAVAEFEDKSLPVEDRLRALKTAIHLCTESY
jgi:hypothetical protein